MQALVPLILAAFAALTFAFPTSLETRSKQVCANAPSTVAGTTLHHRANGAITWCTPNTRTYIILKVIAIVWQEEAAKLGALVSGMKQSWEQYIAEHGDNIVDGGVFAYAFRDLGLQFRFQNANNHQLTIGVMKAGLVALWDWMEQHEVATCTFDIFDGDNQVGKGEFVGL